MAQHHSFMGSLFMKKFSVVFILPAVAILVGMFVVQLTSARTESQTVDEGVHLTAGYSYWKTGDFRLNPEHPPIVKLLASVPLLFLPIHLPLSDPSWNNRDEWAFARHFLYENTVHADWILLLGRIPMMLLGVVLALCVGLWSRKLWGTLAGLLSLTLCAFDPTILAHSRYVTTDVGIALFFFLTIYFFGRYLEQPGIRRWWLVALFFVLAQLSKFSAVLLWGILPIIWFLRHWVGDHQHAFGLRRALLFFLSLLLATNLSAFVVYGFEFKLPFADPGLAGVYQSGQPWQPDVLRQQPPLAQSILNITKPRTISGALIRFGFAHIPLPAYSYFRGLASVTWHEYWGHMAYLLGNFRTTGWWYYFPVAFLVKTPFATIILLGLTLIYLARLFFDRLISYRQRGRDSVLQKALFSYRSADFSYTLLIIPPLVYFLISCTNKIDLGIRHLLPIYPFLFVLIGSLTTVKFSRLQPAWHALLYSFVALFFIGSAITYPYYLAYFSELVGGPNQGARYLTDSNLDWGQELKALGRYMDDQHIPFVYIVYFGQAPLNAYLKGYRFLPTISSPDAIAQLDGWVAISATALFDASGSYDWLRRLHPTTKIGYAIFLYDLRKQQ
ncbi:MAG: glycosyltransferase family 39 protein [bacterium]